MTDRPIVLVVDQDRDSAICLADLAGEQFDIRAAEGTIGAAAILEREWVQIVLASGELDGRTGAKFLETVRHRWPDVVRLLMTEEGRRGEAIAHANGAKIHDVLTRPWCASEVALKLDNAASFYRLSRESEVAAAAERMAGVKESRPVHGERRAIGGGMAEDEIIRAETSPMNAICQTLKQIANYDISVLLTGESGTGKELAARALHANSLRWNKPFVVENCGALPDELLESELFGHVRGAFTGAVGNHTGLFERADGGTLFLDEIGEISPAFQVKLLRVIQEGEIRPLGGQTTRRVDVRVIAATNRDLEEDVRNGRFREDLYYRLATVTVAMPPLRERAMDIPVIADALIQRAERQLGKSVGGLSDDAAACLAAYSWPGNVRELYNEVRHLLVMADHGAEIGIEVLNARIRAEAPAGLGEDTVPAIGLSSALDTLCSLDGTLKERIEVLEARILEDALTRHNGNKSRTARELGLSRVGLRAKLERHGLYGAEAPEQAGRLG